MLYNTIMMLRYKYLIINTDMGSVMVSIFDLKTCESEFESHWVPQSFGLGPHLSKKLRKLLLSTNIDMI